MSIWFTSDQHYFHEKIIQYVNRPFENAAEMNQELIRLHNSVVKPDDTVYIVGDFALTTMSNVEYVLSQLNGRKILIGGNHDDRRVHNAKGWELTCGSMMLQLNGLNVRLHHYPNGRDKFDDWDFYFHGHSHNNVLPTKNSIDVGVDSAYYHLGEYRPFSLNELADIMESQS